MPHDVGASIEYFKLNKYTWVKLKYTVKKLHKSVIFCFFLALQQPYFLRDLFYSVV